MPTPNTPGGEDLAAEAEIESFASWGRYLFWATLQKERFDSFMREPSNDTEIVDIPRWFALVSHWYASLFVVIEGWRNLDLADNFIDALLSHRLDYTDLLRRFRNAVYHFQPAIVNDRTTALLNTPDAAVHWADALHAEFCRYLWQWPERCSPSFDTAKALRAEIGDLLGWLPTDSLAARITSLEETVREVEGHLVRDPASPQLRSIVEQSREALATTRRSLLAHQQRFVDSGWVPGDFGT